MGEQRQLVRLCRKFAEHPDFFAFCSDLNPKPDIRTFQRD